MKILEILFNLAGGGAQRFVVDLSNELCENNDVTLLTLKDDSVNPTKNLFYKQDLSESVRYENLGLSDGFGFGKLIKVYKFINELRPDVIHMNGHGIPPYCIIAVALLGLKVKFFQTIHNDINNGYRNVFYRIFMAFFGRLKIVHFIALSEKNYRDFKKVYPYIDVTCIVNGRAPMASSAMYEITRKELMSLKKTSATKIFVHVARCHEVKNQIRLVTAFNMFVEKGNDAILVIVGSGFDSQLGQKIKTIAGPSVFFVGEKHNIADYQLCADAFCLSSDFEGMPISLIEALLSGTPAVSTPVCGAVDAIVNGENGMVSSDFSVESYVKSLEYVYDNIEYLKKKTESMISESPYTMKKCAEKYMDFLSK